jgi:hypothetical protein
MSNITRVQNFFFLDLFDLENDMEDVGFRIQLGCCIGVEVMNIAI